MDLFGIGQAVKGAMLIYFQSARGAGRTTSLVESVKDGDRICFTNQREADRVKHLCLERGVNVECIVVDPRNPEEIFHHGSVLEDGRNIFDHGWLEEYYMHCIERAKGRVDVLERETSGWGEAHRITRRRAIEMAKWDI